MALKIIKAGFYSDFRRTAPAFDLIEFNYNHFASSGFD